LTIEGKKNIVEFIDIENNEVYQREELEIWRA
jgi:hypothetical protein